MMRKNTLFEKRILVEIALIKGRCMTNREYVYILIFVQIFLLVILDKYPLLQIK